MRYSVTLLVCLLLLAIVNFDNRTSHRLLRVGSWDEETRETEESVREREFYSAYQTKDFVNAYTHSSSNQSNTQNQHSIHK